MNKLSETILKLRVLIIFSTIALTIFFGFGLTRLRINSDIFTYLKPNDPAVKLFNRVGEDFKGNFLVMVGIETDDIFTPANLNLIKDLTNIYKDIDGVTSVMSLINILDIRKTEGILEVGKLIEDENIPDTQEDLEKLRNYVMSKELYRGKIISVDGKTTLIICRIKPDVNKIEVARQIRSLTLAKQDQAKFYFSGLPIQMTDMLATIRKDVLRLVPIVSIVIIVVLFLSFYTIRGVLLPLIAVLFSTTWTMGLMGWVGTPLSMISNVMPVVLIAIGSAYGIHFISKYYEDASQSVDCAEVSKKALRETLIPILLAGVTTLIGFLSFVGSYLTAITEFGIYMAVGISFAIIISVTFIPAVNSFISVNKRNNQKDKRIHLFTRMTELISQIVLRHRVKILIVTLVIVLICISGMPMVRREVDLLEYFPKTSDTRISEEMMRAKFGGSIPIQIVVKGDMKDPFVLKKVRQIEKYIDSFEHISNTQSVADLICQMNEVMNGHYTIPETQEGVANLWFFIEGQEILEQLVNSDLTEGLIGGRLSTGNSRKTLQIVKAIDEYISQMNKEGDIVSVSGLDQSTLHKIKDWLIEDISEMIYFDAIGRFPNISLDRHTIKTSIREIIYDENIKLKKDLIDEFRNEMMDFFDYESNLIIPSDDDRNKIISLVIDSVLSSNTDRADFKDILTKNVKGESLETIASTSETIAVKARNIINKARVENAIEKLADLFPKEVANNHDFIDDLREDLCTINEEFWAIPKGFTESGIVGKFQISITQAGSPVIYNRLDISILKSQIQSLIIAFVVVFLIITIQFRSIKAGLIAVSPIAITVLVNFGIMAYFKSPLDIATTMVSGIAIGVGIDYAIHFTNRLKNELKQNSNIELAIVKTLNTTGKAIMTNAISIALGLLVLLMAQLVPIRRFGWMVASTMIISSLATITYMPSIMLVSHIERGLIKRSNKTL